MPDSGKFKDLYLNSAVTYPCQGGHPGPVEHFRPRNPATGSQLSHFGADLTFNWLNLMYACPECQDKKGRNWPGTLVTQNEQLTDGELTQMARNK